MIGNRTRGLRLLSHGFIVLYMLVLFGVALLFTAVVLKHMNVGQVDIPIYFLAVFLAGLLSYRFKDVQV